MTMVVPECEEGLLEYIRKPSPPPFLVKTYMLVEDPATDEVISWNPDGTAFVVWQTAEFARDLLPTLFKHSNFSSFVRQLNTYGFRKVATSRWEFSNELFRKGKKELLCEIRRRKAWSNNKRNSNNNEGKSGHHHNEGAASKESDQEEQRSSSATASSYSEYNVLVDENKRLKKENGVLSYELSVVKSKCKELLDLVTICTSSSNKAAEEETVVKGNDDIDEVMMMKSRRPRLFGVTLQVHEEQVEDMERKRKQRKRGDDDEIKSSEISGVFLSQPCK